MKKDKPLNEVIEAIYLEQKERYIDENKVIISSKIPLLLPKQSQKKIDYSKLFSYLGGGVKENPYLDYHLEKSIKNNQHKRETKEIINYKEIVDIVKTSKMDRLLGRSSELINLNLKEKFDNFKRFNQQYVMLLYYVVGV